jgi:phosphatidylinositol alpha-mannosyltransferase
LLVALGLSVGGLADVGVRRVEASLAGSKPGLITAGLALMSAAMLLRALSWHAILRSAPTWRRARLGDAVQGTCIGVLMSATLPARMGEPARALIVARRLGRVRETLPVVLGTVVSQMLLNLLAVVILAVVTLTGVRGQQGDDLALLVLAASPVAALMALLLAPAIVPGGRLSRPMSVGDLVGEVRAAMRRVRGGLHVFGHPPKAAAAVVLQLGAWAVQWISCWLLLDAVGLSGPVGLGGAAAVLFAINLTAILPITPANVGIFQLAVVTVLVGGYHVAAPAALAFGIVLQAVEIATALGMGMPALAREGLSWRELRMRTVHAASIKLGPVPSSVPAAENASAVA